MIALEIPLWLLICFVVLHFLIFIHLVFSDFFAKIFYKIIKEKEKNNERNTNEH